LFGRHGLALGVIEDREAHAQPKAWHDLGRDFLGPFDLMHDEAQRPCVVLGGHDRDLGYRQDPGQCRQQKAESQAGQEAGRNTRQGHNGVNRTSGNSK
jgi:hypothetical protein